MKKLMLSSALLILFSGVQCKVVRKAMGRKEAIKVDSMQSISVSKEAVKIDSMKLSTDVSRKRTTNENYSTSTMVIEVPAKDKPIVVNAGKDLMLDSTSTLDTLKYRSASNPNNGMNIFLNPDNANEALAEILKDGHRIITPFSKITFTDTRYNKSTTEDLDSLGNVITNKIIANSIDSTSTTITSVAADRYETKSDVVVNSKGWQGVAIAVIVIVVAAVLIYFWKFRNLFKFK